MDGGGLGAEGGGDSMSKSGDLLWGGGDRSQHGAGKGAVCPVSKDNGRMFLDPQTRTMGASRGDV